MERSKDITHVKLLPSLVAKMSDICDVNVNSLFIIHDRLVICMLRNSAYVLSKLILKLSQVFYIMFSLKLFARYKMVNLNDLVGFALTLTARH